MTPFGDIAPRPVSTHRQVPTDLFNIVAGLSSRGVVANRKAMWLNGSHIRHSSSPAMPPRMSTVRVVPTPRGSGLVQVTLVITLAQCGQDAASVIVSVGNPDAAFAKENCR